ncbi:MAG: translocation protein TolB [Bryobacteraceae bacterium]
MNSKVSWVITGAVATALWLPAQDVVIKIMGGTSKPALAAPDFRAAGAAAPHMASFNEALFSDLQNAGMFDMVAKTMYPLQAPQRPEEFRPPAPPPSRPAATTKKKKGKQADEPPPKPVSQGPWLTDWSAPPANATHLAFGYAAEQAGQFAVFGWLFDVTQKDTTAAHLLGKRYFAPLNEQGARRAAHEFAADIIAQFGGQSLLGSKIFFVSDRTGGQSKEIWSMDPDGAGQKQVTDYKSISTSPAVSPDSSKLAFTTYARGNPGIFVHLLETGRRLTFVNQPASMNASPNFSPDGQMLLYSSSASGYAQIYSANIDGGNTQRLSNSRAVEVEPKVSPKGGEIAFVSGRSGTPQVYLMTRDGSNVERLTTGEGDAVNPSWHPNGQVMAFSWSRGYEPGNFNIFLMDVASRRFEQLTHGMGRNENPTWAPDGRHLVFCSTRSGTPQIWTMLADGTKLQQLTTAGKNTMPVWAK